MINSKKIFLLILLTLTVAGCSSLSSNKDRPTTRDTICADLKAKLLFNQPTPGMDANQNKMDPAQQAEIMNAYNKYNCDQAST
jgi:hypothetical protein